MRRLLSLILVLVLVVAMPLSAAAATLSRPVFTTHVHEAIAWAKKQSGSTSYYAVFIKPTSIDTTVSVQVFIVFYASKSAAIANATRYGHRLFESTYSSFAMKSGSTEYSIGTQAVSGYKVIRMDYTSASGNSSYNMLGFFVEDLSTYTVPSATLSVWRSNSLVLNVGQLPKLSQFNSVVASMKAISNDNYTESSWQAFQLAIIDSVALQTKGYWFESDVMAVIDEMNLKYTALEFRPDPAALKELILQVEACDESQYTTISWESLQLVVTSAKQLLASGDYTEANLKEAESNISAAMQALEILPDPTTLQDIVSEVEEFDELQYTASSWRTFQAAVSFAKQLLLSGNYTDSDLKQAEARIASAMRGLVKEGPPPPGVVVTDRMFEPLIESIHANIRIIVPIAISVFGIMIGFALIPKIVRRYTKE